MTSDAQRDGRTHQDVEAGGLQQGDLVGDGERGEARQLLGELHRLDDALGGQLAELVPQVDVQSHAVLRAVTLKGPDRNADVDVFFSPFNLLSNVHLDCSALPAPLPPTHPSYALIVCCTSWHLTLIVCCTSWHLTLIVCCTTSWHFKIVLSIA